MKLQPDVPGVARFTVPRAGRYRTCTTELRTGDRREATTERKQGQQIVVTATNHPPDGPGKLPISSFAVPAVPMTETDVGWVHPRLPELRFDIEVEVIEDEE